MATAKKKPSSLAKLPPALRERAEAVSAHAKSRLIASAREALAHAHAAYGEAQRGMYELGKALQVLAKPGMAEAAGNPRGFYALCEEEFGLARATVTRLLRAIGMVTEEQFSAQSRTRLDALLDLATATEADDTEAILSGAEITLWEKGPHLDAGSASTDKLREAAAEVRAHLAGGAKRRGKSASVAERAAAKKATQRLQARGLAGEVKVRATKPGQPSVFDVVGLDAEGLKSLLGK